MTDLSVEALKPIETEIFHSSQSYPENLEELYFEKGNLTELINILKDCSGKDSEKVKYPMKMDAESFTKYLIDVHQV